MLIIFFSFYNFNYSYKYINIYIYIYFRGLSSIGLKKFPSFLEQFTKLRTLYVFIFILYMIIIKLKSEI